VEDLVFPPVKVQALFRALRRVSSQMCQLQVRQVMSPALLLAFAEGRDLVLCLVAHPARSRVLSRVLLLAPRIVLNQVHLRAPTLARLEALLRARGKLLLQVYLPVHRRV
jgi:hypothetical protein